MKPLSGWALFIKVMCSIVSLLILILGILIVKQAQLDVIVLYSIILLVLYTWLLTMGFAQIIQHLKEIADKR